MDLAQAGHEVHSALEESLGYLNFSAGASDPRFLKSLCRLFWVIEEQPALPTPSDGQQAAAWQTLAAWLKQTLGDLADRSAAFADTTQASAVVAILFDEFLPRYRRDHADLFFHLDDAELFRPLLIGRAAEAILQQQGPWTQRDRILTGALAKFNDFIGYRPVAVLESQKLEPYAKEWLRPVPLYVEGVPVAPGRYRQIVERALAILRQCDGDILHQACFDPEALEELAFDPRAYDFDHPVNKRPNYHFGQWDPHYIDNTGRYRRFVVQKVTLDALLARLDPPGHQGAEESLFEAAAALAGTILMASGTSGAGPATHDSSVTLASLLGKIAGYRDAFYDRLLARMDGPHGERLRQEAAERRQPFGGVRQALNQELARLRATQLQHVHLAMVFARMGYVGEAIEQANIVPVASARMTCEINCRLTAAHLALGRGELDRAAEFLPQVEQLLHRAIECGALVDPWNILGFDAQFSLFPALENSIRDYRVDDLLDLIERIFDAYGRIWAEAGAVDNTAVQERLSEGFTRLANWWDQFATPIVSSVEGFDGSESLHAASQVARAMSAWHKGGASSGDVGFWRGYVELFESTKGFAQVAEALLDRRDFVASMALMMHWLSQCDQIDLEEGGHSFYALAIRWMDELTEVGQSGGPLSSERWTQAVKFLDYLEANAQEYWEVPELELGSDATAHRSPGEPDTDMEGDDLEAGLYADEDEDEEDADDRFSAAYEGMIYRDSASDGYEGEILDSPGATTDYELEEESRRLFDRLAFLRTMARLWKRLAMAHLSLAAGADEAPQRWLEQIRVNRRRLLELMESVRGRRIPEPSGSLESLVEFDRRRSIRDALLERIITTCVETISAGHYVAAAFSLPVKLLGAHRRHALQQDVIRALFRGEAGQTQAAWPEFLESLVGQPLLYVPLARGGDPAKIVAARSLQQVIRDLLVWLPRAGMLSEACQLIQAAQRLELRHSARSGAVTEFDRLFERGFKAIVESLIDSSRHWKLRKRGAVDGDEYRDQRLVQALQDVTEPLLVLWLDHSRTLRLSAMEKAAEDRRWNPLVSFIKRYGADLFTQRFMNLGNLRAILHQGVGAWLDRLADEPDDDHVGQTLVEAISAGQISRKQAIEQLSLVLEAAVEHYDEYRDYNSTTTQSDRGDMLYTLLDFLRLRSDYERVAWNLRPVIVAHEVLVRRGRPAAAELWRRALSGQTSEIADGFTARLSNLETQYGMRLPSVADRFRERFVRPLAIDRLRAIVQGAIDELLDSDAKTAEAVRFSTSTVESTLATAEPSPRSAGRKEAAPPAAEVALGAFDQLQQEIAEFTQQPSGAGLDVPPWLEALEEEVDLARTPGYRGGTTPDPQPPLDEVHLSISAIEQQIRAWQDASPGDAQED